MTFKNKKIERNKFLTAVPNDERQCRTIFRDGINPNGKETISFSETLPQGR